MNPSSDLKQVWGVTGRLNTLVGQQRQQAQEGWHTAQPLRFIRFYWHVKQRELPLEGFLQSLQAVFLVMALHCVSRLFAGIICNTFLGQYSYFWKKGPEERQDLEPGSESFPVGGYFWLVGLTLRRRLAAERRARSAHDGGASRSFALAPWPPTSFALALPGALACVSFVQQALKDDGAG